MCQQAYDDLLHIDGTIRTGLLDKAGQILDIGDDALGLPAHQAILLNLHDWPTKLSNVDCKRLQSITDPDVRFGPPEPTPRKMMAVGLNYRDRCRERGVDVPERPIVSANSDSSALQGGVGRRRTHLRWWLHGSERRECADAQLRGGQWTLGKSNDTFSPMCPMVVVADEISDLQNLKIRWSVNGELQRESSTSEMVFPVAELVAYASDNVDVNDGM